MPFLLEGEGVQRWSTAAHAQFCQQVDHNVGVDILDGLLLKGATLPSELPWFARLTNMTVETPESDSRIPSFYKSALRFSTPIVCMEPYLTYLEKRASMLGVTIELTATHTPDGKSTKWDAEQVAEFIQARFGYKQPVLVNCGGIGAGAFADDEMIPVRGIIVRVQRPSDRRYMISEDSEDGVLSKNGMIAYAIPRGNEYTLGGSILEGDWEEKTTEEEKRRVKELANGLIPGIGKQPETGVWSGLRPTRRNGTARVELQQEGLAGRKEFDVVANYGHGGSGVTTCWGCANEVVEIVAGLASA